MDYFGPRLVDKSTIITEDVSYRRRSRANSLADYDETPCVTSTVLSVVNPTSAQETPRSDVFIKCGVTLYPIIITPSFGSTDSEGSFNSLSISSHNSSFRSTPGPRNNRSPRSPCGQNKEATPPLSPHSEIAQRMSYYRQQAVKYSYWASTPPSTPHAAHKESKALVARRRFSEAIMAPLSPPLAAGHHRVRSISSDEAALDFAALMRGEKSPPQGRGDGILFSTEYLMDVQREGYEVSPAVGLVCEASERVVEV